MRISEMILGNYCCSTVTRPRRFSSSTRRWRSRLHRNGRFVGASWQYRALTCDECLGQTVRNFGAERKATSHTEDTRPSVRREFEKERGDRVLDGVGEHAGAHGFAPLCHQAEQDAHERDGQGAAPPLIQMDGAE